MIQLPPSEFTYGKYGTIVVPWKSLKTKTGYYKWLLTQNIIGYCNSMECEIRPRTNEMAVMFEEDSWQSWSHVPIDIWKEYLKLLKLKEQYNETITGKSNKSDW